MDSTSSSPPYLPLEEDNQISSNILKPSPWLVQLITFQADFITNLLTFLSSPFITLASDTIYHAEEAKETVEETVVAATRVPSQVAEGGFLVLKKLGFGCLGAFYVCMILIAALILAIVLGVGLVRLWVEEPVFVQEPLHFDYTKIHPTAVFPLQEKKKWVVPVGHTYYVSIVLLMPESDFNRHIGVFQVSAEIISSSGKTLAMSSQPCMLPFRSLPVRLMHTFIMGVPLLLGISGETQTIAVTILKHTEGYPRTGKIRAALQPRAGTSGLPQIYSANIVLNSELPFMKRLVYKWKWTAYVWTSLYVYIMLLVMFVCFCRPLLFPMGGVGIGSQGHWSVVEVTDQEKKVTEDSEALQSLERWRKRGKKYGRQRRALLSRQSFEDTVETSESSGVTFPREEATEVVEDFGGFTDAESVCQGG